MNILAVDVGGTHVKFCTQRHPEVVSFSSGSKMTPKKMMKALEKYAEGWEYDHVSLGFPGPVVHDRPLREPFNLGGGWLTFKFKEAFGGKPLRVINDAAMQALGSYQGGRMLFLGLGTGLGSAMVVNGVVQAMELAHLPWKKGKTYEEFLGEAALEEDGHKAWQKHILQAVDSLSEVLESEYVVLGGGNAKLVKHLPKHVLLGDNANAFKGGFLLWDKAHAQSK